HAATLSSAESGPSGPYGPSAVHPNSDEVPDGPLLRATSESRNEKVAHESGPFQPNPEIGAKGNGPLGPDGPLFREGERSRPNPVACARCGGALSLAEGAAAKKNGFSLHFDCTLPVGGA